MEPLEIKGRITAIRDTQTFASGFSKRQFAVKELIDDYPQEFGMEFAKDKCGILDSYDVGDVVTVNCNLRGNEYNGRHYISLQAWKIAKDGQESRDTRQNGAPPPQDAHNKAKSDGYQPQAKADSWDDDNEKIPF